MYPKSGISPHPVHKAWALSVCQHIVETPMGLGRFDVRTIPKSDFLLIESLYCAPFAKKYKKLHPECKIISLVADTSFWDRKYTIARRFYYKLYLDSVDGFIAVSERIAGDASARTGKLAMVVRPYLVNKTSLVKNAFDKKILFIGNAAEEKGFIYAVRAMKHIKDFDIYLVGSCYKKLSKSIMDRHKNIHIEGVVPSLKRYFQSCTYYIHPADFDPSPVTIWESMYAGLIPIISKNVGQSELFKGKLAKLVLKDTRPETISEKVKEIDNLPLQKKKELVRICKKLASNYTKENSVKEFRQKFLKLLKRSG